jgi:RNA recognition motif-containing protein
LSVVEEKGSLMASKNLYVGNLPFSLDSAGLEALFKEAGAVASASVIIDRMSGRSRGFGFVEMASEAEAQKAIEMLNGREIEGRKLIVNEARPREERPERNFRPRR